MKKQLLFTFLFLFIAKLTFASFNIDQGNWRWRNNDGDKTSATWRANENTAIEIFNNDTLRLRMEVASRPSGFPDNIDLGFIIQYKDADSTEFLNIPVNADSLAFKIPTTNAYLINGDSTTKILNGNQNYQVYKNLKGNTVFNSNQVYFRVSSTDSTIREYEIVIVPTSNILPGKRYNFRLSNLLYPVTLPSLTTATTLPISLKSLTAKKAMNGISLAWKTSSEINNKYFDLQRSNDGIKWLTIAEITGKGNSNSETNYSYLDKNPTNGINYYRLVQYDVDGKTTVSKVVSEKFETITQEIHVYPNPFIDKVNIHLQGYDGQLFDVALYDLNGKEILNKKMQVLNSNLELNLNNTSSDKTYILKISGNGLNFNKKISAK